MRIKLVTTLIPTLCFFIGCSPTNSTTSGSDQYDNNDTNSICQEEGSTTLVSPISTSEFTFSAEPNDCIGDSTAFNQTKVLPLTIDATLPEGFTLSDTAKVSNASVTGITFTLTNHSGDNRCFVEIITVELLDENNESVLLDDGSYLEGELMQLSSVTTNTCLANGKSQMVPLVINYGKTDISSATKAVIGNITVSSIGTPIADISAESMTWYSESTEFNFTHNGIDQLNIGSAYPQVHYFDRDGFLLNQGFLAPNAASTVVDAGDSFKLIDNYYSMDGAGKYATVSLDWDVPSRSMSLRSLWHSPKYLPPEESHRVRQATIRQLQAFELSNR